MTRNWRNVLSWIHRSLAVERDDVVRDSLLVPLGAKFFAVAFTRVATIGSHHLIFSSNNKAEVFVVFMVVGLSHALKQQVASSRIAGFPTVTEHALSAVKKNRRRRIGHGRLD